MHLYANCDDSSGPVVVCWPLATGAVIPWPAMGSTWTALAATACLGVASSLQGQGTTAAGVTEPGRTMTRAVDLIVGGRSQKAIERTLLLVVDPSEALVKAEFLSAFQKAMADNQASLGKTRIGLGIVGVKNTVVVPPTSDHAVVLQQMQARLTRQQAGLRNVYQAVRDGAAVLAQAAGERTLVLVTLENGDLEDNVAKTVAQLQRGKIRVEVVASETTLADSYWRRNRNQQVPNKTKLVGGDGAIVDVPWGLLFQREPANEMTPAGYAMWGLTRLAAATDGRVFLYASKQQQRHVCAFYGTCLFCDNDHELPDSGWNSALVDQVAPLVSARRDALKEMGRDAAFRLVMKTWLAAAKAGLISSEPGVRVAATSASRDRARAGRDLRLLATGNFARSAKRAEAAARKAAKMRDQLLEAIDALPQDGVSHRARATAKYLAVLLQLTQVNLLTFSGFCRDYAPEWFDVRTGEPLPPEVEPFDRDRRPMGIHYYNLSLCHGVRPFYDVELPGGEQLRQELMKLDAMFNSFQRRYGKSQFGYALRRNGIARFYPTFPGISKGPVRRRPKSSVTKKGPITPKRPTRRGGSSGPAGGPTTGGGR